MSILSSESKSKLQNVLEKWIQKPKSSLKKRLKKNDLKWEYYESIEISKCITKGLELLLHLPSEKFNERADKNINELVNLFYTSSSDESDQYLNTNAMPHIPSLLDRLKIEPIKTDSYDSTEMELLKLMSSYANKSGFERLVTYIKDNFKPDDYSWDKIFRNISSSESKSKFVITELNGFIPDGFAGITFLDMCNTRGIKDDSFSHPFNNDHGYTYLKNILEDYKKTEENESYVISVITTLPFINNDYRIAIIEIANSFDSEEIDIELAWVGAKLGEESQIQKLVEFYKDPRTSEKAEKYLHELNLSHLIPSESEDSEFQVLKEMSSWLNHPNEYGSNPDSIEIIAQKYMFWPPSDGFKTMSIVKYTYTNYKNSGKDDINVGMVGSTTFSLWPFDLGSLSFEIHKLKIEEIYGIYCIWEQNGLDAIVEKGKLDTKAAGEYIKAFNPEIEEW